jgi:mono/diheme cytochrome c family protein
MAQRSIGLGAFTALLGATLWIGSGSVLRAQDGPGPRPAEPYLQNERASKPVPASLPPELGQGRRLYVAKCAACHTLSRSMNKSDLSPQEWSDIVDRMRNRAASHLNDAQAKAIVAYLVWDDQQRQKKAEESK